MPATWRNCERTPNCGAASANYGLCVVNIDAVDARECAATRHRELPAKSLAEVTENNVLKISPMVGVERFELPTLWSQTRCATRLRYTPSVPAMGRYTHLNSAATANGCFRALVDEFSRTALPSAISPCAWSPRVRSGCDCPCGCRGVLRCRRSVPAHSRSGPWNR